MKKWFLPSLIFAHLLYLQALNFYPYPELFTYPYLASKGFVPFRDILDQHFPTLLDLPINLWNLGMHTELHARLVFFALLTITHILIYKIAKRIHGKSINALLPNIIYAAIQPLFDGGTFWIDTFVTPLVLGAVLALFYGIESKKIHHWISAGFLLGLSLISKQTTLPFVAGIFFLLFIIKKTRIHSIVLGFFISTPFALMCLWIYSQGIWSEFLYWTITFNTNVYSKMSVIYPSSAQFLRVFVIWGITLAVYFFAKRKSLELRILFVSVLTLSIYAIGRFGLSYLQVALPFVILLFSGTLEKGSVILPKSLNYYFKRIPIGIAIFCVGILLSLWHMRYFAIHSTTLHYFSTEETKNLVSKIEEKSDEDDHIFIFGGNPVLYALTQTVPAGHIFTVLVPWNYSVAQDRIVEGLKEDPPKLIVVEDGAEIDGIKGEDFGKEVLEYIKDNYQKEDAIAGYTFYKSDVLPDFDPASAF